MCDLCEKVKANSEYTTYMEKMLDTDKKRIEFSKKMTAQFSFISAYSSIKYPTKLVYPFFEARTAYAVPQNYFQQIFVNGETLSPNFAHGSMRSVFFSGKRLMLLSKSVSHAEGEEFFNSFLLVHFEPNEYKYVYNGEEFTLSVDCEKTMTNLLNGKNDKVKVRFNFINRDVVNRIVSREKVVNSAHLKTVYEKYGALDRKMASVDMEGYAITVPHFSPHPYLLQLAEKLGYESGRQMQEKTMTDYFRKHLE